MTLKWKPYAGKFVTGEIGNLGKWDAFSVFYDTTVSIGDSKKYVLKCKLPGITGTVGHFEHVSDAKEKAHSLCSYWILNAGLCIAEEPGKESL